MSKSFFCNGNNFNSIHIVLVIWFLFAFINISNNSGHRTIVGMISPQRAFKVKRCKTIWRIHDLNSSTRQQLSELGPGTPTSFSVSVQNCSCIKKRFNVWPRSEDNLFKFIFVMSFFCKKHGRFKNEASNFSILWCHEISCYKQRKVV